MPSTSYTVLCRWRCGGYNRPGRYYRGRWVSPIATGRPAEDGLCVLAENQSLDRTTLYKRHKRD